MKYTNVFYFRDINSIGGIETFFYQLAKKYGDKFDITLFYCTGDPKQIKRLSEHIRVKKYKDGQVIKAKRMFVCFNTEILDHVEADEYYQMLHGDYTSLGVYPNKHPKIQKWVSVSEVVRDAYLKGKGEESIVCYNPYEVVKAKKVLNLVSATRLTPDKGFNRMLALAEAFDNAGIPYLWTVYTDQPNKPINNPNIILCKPRLDIIDFIGNADYFVQLSDAEGYCYSVVEALSVGTPVIVTEFKVATEIGVEDRKNGFILRMDMKNIPVDDIYRGLKRFKYTPKQDIWDQLLLPGGAEKIDPETPTDVKCIRVFYDMQAGKMRQYGEVWETTLKRFEELDNLNLVEEILE